jgi:hypothetical protein
MRMNARSISALASALLLAAAAAAVSGCGKPESDVHRLPNTISVTLTYDKTTGKASMSGTDKSVELSEKFHDIVKWHSPDGEIHIVKWTPSMPFDKDPEPDPTNKKVLKSGPPKTGSHNQGGTHCKDHANHDAQCYEYEAELWLNPPDENKHVPIDPIIVVME